VQFTRETTPANVIAAWEPGRIRIANRWLDGHVIVAADRVVEGWRVARPKDVVYGDLEPAIALNPEIIVLGTGHSIAWPDTDLMSALARVVIGHDIMPPPAACRTYTVLVHEQRRVVAALFTTETDQA
jgi:uncharacterized protein